MRDLYDRECGITDNDERRAERKKQRAETIRQQKEQKEKEMNEAAFEFAQLPPDGNEARRAALGDTVWCFAYELYYPKETQSEEGYETSELLWEVFEETITRYVPEEEYSHYFSKVFKKRRNGMLESLAKKRQKRVCLDDEDILKIESDDNQITSKVRMDGIMMDLTSLVLCFSERHKGREGNEKRL